MAPKSGKSQRWLALSLLAASGRSAAWVGGLLLGGMLACRPPVPASSARVHVLPAPPSGAERTLRLVRRRGRGGPLLRRVALLVGAPGGPRATRRRTWPRPGRAGSAASTSRAPTLPPAARPAPGRRQRRRLGRARPPERPRLLHDLFDFAGCVDPESGEVRALRSAGLGLNELALGPDGQLLVTRYGSRDDDEGSLVVLDGERRAPGRARARGPARLARAPKSLALDPVRREIWLNTDLLPLDGARRCATTRACSMPRRRERLRFERPRAAVLHLRAGRHGLVRRGRRSRRLRAAPSGSPQRSATASCRSTTPSIRASTSCRTCASSPTAAPS